MVISMDQSGDVVANPARGQLNRKMNILSPFAPENLVSRDRFGSPVPVQYSIPIQYKYVPGVLFVFVRGHLVQYQYFPICHLSVATAYEAAFGKI